MKSYERIKEDLLKQKGIKTIVLDSVVNKIVKNKEKLFKDITEVIKNNIKTEGYKIEVVFDEYYIKKEGIYIIEKNTAILEIVKMIKLDDDRFLYMYLTSNSLYLLKMIRREKGLEDLKKFIKLSIDNNRNTDYELSDTYKERIKDINKIEINNNINNIILKLVKDIYNNEKLDIKEKREKLEILKDNVLKTI